MVTHVESRSAVNLDCFYLSTTNEYFCEGKLNASLQEEDAVTFTGNHVSGYSDDDVKYFFNNQRFVFQRIPSEVFAKFRNLQVFDLNAADLSSISSESFKNCAKLEEIDLDDNKIVKVSPQSFISCSSLTTISLRKNVIPGIEKGIFKGVERLENLDLSQNRIAELTDEIFSPLNALKQLKMSKNIIRKIHARAFDSLKTLELLDLSENFIESLDSTVFINCKALLTLKLSKNLIKTLNDQVFQFQKNLKSIDLSENQLGRLSARTFRELEALKMFIVNKAMITGVEANLFNDKANLTKLDFRGNICIDKQFDNNDDIEIVKQGLQVCFDNFKKAFCKYSINDEGFYICELSANFLINETSIDYEVSGDHIDLKSDQDVQVIHSTNSQIDSIPEEISKKFPRIEKLSLWNVGLNDLNENNFDSFSNLKSLDLRLNQIASVENESFPIPLDIEILILVKT